MNSRPVSWAGALLYKGGLFNFSHSAAPDNEGFNHNVAIILFQDFDSPIIFHLTGGFAGNELRYIDWLLFEWRRFDKVSFLSRQRAQVRRKHSEYENFNVMHQFCVVHHVPAEMVPKLSASLALLRAFDSMADVPLPNVNGHGAVVENIDSLPAAGVCPNPFNVFLISRPHRSVFVHNRSGSRS